MERRVASELAGEGGVELKTAIKGISALKSKSNRKKRKTATVACWASKGASSSVSARCCSSDAAATRGSRRMGWASSREGYLHSQRDLRDLSSAPADCPTGSFVSGVVALVVVVAPQHRRLSAEGRESSEIDRACQPDGPS